MEKCYNQLCDEHENVTAKMVKHAYLFKPEPKPTLMQAFKVHNEEFAEKVSKGRGTKGTLGRYERLKGKVEAYLNFHYFFLNSFNLTINGKTHP